MKAHDCSRKLSELDAYSGAREKFAREFTEASRRYLNDFVSAKCSADLLAWGVFPNAKEITESFAAYWGIVRYVPEVQRNKPAVLIAVGDGCTPRTAATFAVRSTWRCLSVDPLTKGCPQGLNRVKCYPLKAEDLKGVVDCRGLPVIIVAVHSHAKLTDAVSIPYNYSSLSVLAMECCVPQRLGRTPPDVEYEDKGVWSPKNYVRIWRDYTPQGGAIQC